VERCFEGCVNEFKLPAKLQPTEGQCVQRCVEKFARYSQRFQQAYAEDTLAYQQKVQQQQHQS